MIRGVGCVVSLASESRGVANDFRRFAGGIGSDSELPRVLRRGADIFAFVMMLVNNDPASLCCRVVEVDAIRARAHWNEQNSVARDL